jgi:putative aminopeptidase FrvX
MEQPLLGILTRLLEQPTAPFHERAVAQQIRIELEGCADVRVEEDGMGNLVACYRKGRVAAPWAFAAHMDHPAYVDDPAGGGRVFLGGVPEEYRKMQPPVRDFGAFAMWDLPAWELVGDRLYSRACDDLVGCAVVVRLLQQLQASSVEGCVYGIFTRAEEVGFVGAVQLARSGQVPLATRVISLETSSERGGVCKMGDGVIVRVGDRTSTFDPGVTAYLASRAKEAEVPYQRALMTGGTCEASAYQAYGYTTGALCVALGNYHNCGEAFEIASEFVSLVDVDAMSRLCLAAASDTELGDPFAPLRKRCEKGVEEYSRYLLPES